MIALFRLLLSGRSVYLLLPPNWFDSNMLWSWFCRSNHTTQPQNRPTRFFPFNPHTTITEQANQLFPIQATHYNHRTVPPAYSLFKPHSAITEQAHRHTPCSSHTRQSQNGPTSAVTVQARICCSSLTRWNLKHFSTAGPVCGTNYLCSPQAILLDQILVELTNPIPNLC